MEAKEQAHEGDGEQDRVGQEGYQKEVRKTKSKDRSLSRNGRRREKETHRRDGGQRASQARGEETGCQSAQTLEQDAREDAPWRRSHGNCNEVGAEATQTVGKT